MQTILAYENYIFRHKENILNAIKSRVVYLKIKNRLYDESKKKEDFESFGKILKQQELMIHKLKKNKKNVINYGMKNVHLLNCDKNKKDHIYNKLKQISIMYTWLYSQSNFIKKQKWALKKEYKYVILEKGKIANILSKILKNNLKSSIKKEESELILTMKVFEHRGKTLFPYSKEILKLEKIGNIEFSILKIALFFNLIPIHGIGDILSLPFWILDGILRGYEHKFKDYGEWRKSKKPSLKKLLEELEKVEMVIV